MPGTVAGRGSAMKPQRQYGTVLNFPQHTPRLTQDRQVTGDNPPSDDPAKAQRFREAALPHLHAAYTLARYLLRNPLDPEDAAPEFYLRARRHFDTARRPTINPE